MENLENEIWKDIIGYEGLYQISNLGRVKSLERIIMCKNNSKKKITEKIKKQQIGTTGYYTIMLYKNDLGKNFKVHRLVAISFITNPEKKIYVNHIDFNPLNNSLDNLEWVSNRENSCHAQKNKIRPSKFIGVIWDKYQKKWRAQIRFNKTVKTIGRFKTEEEAYEARKKFEQENGISNKYI